MALELREMRPDEHDEIAECVIDSFEPITWASKLDERIGPLGGVAWRDRWRSRLRAAFASEIVLIGELEGEKIAYASGTYDDVTKLAFLDLLAVFKGGQGKGYGREMLRAFMDNMKQRGALYCQLDCLTDNDNANELYESEGFVKAASSYHWFHDMR